MPAYVIGDVEILDPDRYDEYKAGTPGSIAPFGGRFVARGGRVSVLEGDWDPNRIVIIEFPDPEAARAWYESEDYQRIAEIRRSASKGSLILVEGVD